MRNNNMRSEDRKPSIFSAIERKLPWRFKHVVQPFISKHRIYLSSGWYINIKRFTFERIHPTFLIIGAQKAATSSLFFNLTRHPEVFSPHIKEPECFLESSEMEEQDYLRKLSMKRRFKVMLYGYKGQPLIGESSVKYTMAPAIGKGVPEKIKNTYPDMKLIYIVRNPLDRIVSHYLHYIDSGKTKGSFYDFLTTNKTYLDTSLYFYQINRYLSYFDRSQIKIVFFEDFTDNQHQILSELTEFLNAGNDFKFSDLGVYNISRSRKKMNEKALRFPEDIFDSIIPRIKTDVGNMEHFLGKKLDFWDLSRETWCGDDRQ